MNTYILTERRNFKTFWKENYAVGLDSCYVFNLEHRTEHDIDSAYGACMHYTVPNFTADEFDSLLACNIIRFLFNCLREANFLLSLGGSSQNTGKHWNKVRIGFKWERLLWKHFRQWLVSVVSQGTQNISYNFSLVWS